MTDPATDPTEPTPESGKGNSADPGLRPDLIDLSARQLGEAAALGISEATMRLHVAVERARLARAAGWSPEYLDKLSKRTMNINEWRAAQVGEPERDRSGRFRRTE